MAEKQSEGNVKIHVSHLSKSFGKLEVLKDISVDVHEGEVVVVIGPSGSGKSTFLRCLNRLETATGGEITVDGENILDRRTDINHVRQNMERISWTDGPISIMSARISGWCSSISISFRTWTF